jgi:hypothetical protein
MGEFMVENLYRRHINDVDASQKSIALGVVRFLKRFCYKSPNKSHSIVLRYVEIAIQNAVSVVEQFDPFDPDSIITDKHRSDFKRVATSLMSLCIDTHAKSLIPMLRTFYQGTSLALITDTVVSFDDLIKMIEEKPARVVVDTRSYHSLYEDEQL